MLQANQKTCIRLQFKRCNFVCDRKVGFCVANFLLLQISMKNWDLSVFFRSSGFLCGWDGIRILGPLLFWKEALLCLFIYLKRPRKEEGRLAKFAHSGARPSGGERY